MASVSASIFSLPIPSWLHSTGPRITQYDRKRKKTDDYVDDTTGLDTTDGSGTESAPAGQSLVLTPNESHQYRIAGLPFDHELPGGHFPHGPDKDAQPARRNIPSQLQQDLSSLPTPIYAPHSAAQQGSLRLQHLSVLVTVLHRCLLEGDFIRAGRAWGLILREEFRGHPVDVRRDGRWGIGAEILLRRQRTVVPNSNGHTPLPFTKKGFGEAKEYYEKLILNHPFSKTVPHSISSLHFYPAMFGLWVYVTQEESSMAQRDLMSGDSESDDGLSEDGSSADNEDWRESRRHKLTARLRVHELEQAQQIATRMDSILASPPYSDSAELLELRGMVSLWIGDLLVSSLTTLPPDEDVFDPDAMTDDPPRTFEERRAYRLAMEKRQLEVQKSREFFARAQKRGRGVSYNLEQLHIDEGSPLD